jgi:hypothetical protein
VAQFLVEEACHDLVTIQEAQRSAGLSASGEPGLSAAEPTPAEKHAAAMASMKVAG